MTTVEEAVSLGVSWLLRQPQRDDSLCPHPLSIEAGDYRLVFSPVATNAGAVISFGLSASQIAFGEGGLFNRLLTEQEVVAARRVIESTGVTIVLEWNGAQGTSASFELTQRAHDSLRAAWARFRGGCPEHGRSDPPCWHPVHPDLPPCPWYGFGTALLSTPEVPMDDTTTSSEIEAPEVPLLALAGSASLGEPIILGQEDDEEPDDG